MRKYSSIVKEPSALGVSWGDVGGGGKEEDMLRRVVRWEVTAANRFETLIQLVSSQARSQPATSTLRTSLGRTLISHLRVAPRISQRLTTRQSATGLAGEEVEVLYGRSTWEEVGIPRSAPFFHAGSRQLALTAAWGVHIGLLSVPAESFRIRNGPWLV